MKYIYGVTKNNETINGKWNEKSYKSFIESNVKIFVDGKEFHISKQELNFFEKNFFNKQPEKKIGLNRLRPISLTEIVKK